ncbi:putative carbonate dehydratase [Magnetofaba australis IT-1]|uniref:carbonic anhydrase n=1 Tax=Magnetofaba australis IT-1 TaxID=1434232 RepID=A0A1Y2K2X3_9PROT|nr:putative carbonate dehydratase [Magnetofaba australis IT-1]
MNISETVEALQQPLIFNYGATAKEVINNGHTIQANLSAGSELAVDNMRFELRQFHFHSPSENQFDGVSYPLEAHFVHVGPKGELAVVGVMFRLGAENAELAKIWAKLPESGEKATVEAVDPNLLLPASRDYYRFSGSLTTPPCSEGVRWLMMKEPLTLSSKQVDQFVNLMGGPNNRPIQPLNARRVMR